MYSLHFLQHHAAVQTLASRGSAAGACRHAFKMVLYMTVLQDPRKASLPALSFRHTEVSKADMALVETGVFPSLEVYRPSFPLAAIMSGVAGARLVERCDD